MTHQLSRITTLLSSLLVSAIVLAGGSPFDKEAVIFGPDEDVVMHSISKCSTVSTPGLRVCEEKELDLNNDGHTDLLVGVNHNGKSTLYTGRGEGLFNPPIYFGLEMPTSAIKVADLDGDGDLDIVQTARADGNSGGNYIIVNSGTFNDFLTNEQPLDNLKHDRTASVAVGDVNNDGKLDIVIGNETPGAQSNPADPNLPYTKTNYVYLNQTTTANNIVFGAAITLDPPGTELYTRRIVLLDIEGDGDLDLAATGALNHLDQSGKGNWLYVNHTANGGAGANPFNAPIPLNASTADDTDVANGVAAGDLDGDGDPDLVFSTWSRMNGAVAEEAPDRYYVNNSTAGGPNFETTGTFGPQGHSTNVELGDFDNDTDLDALILAFEDGPNRLHRNLNDSVPGSYFENAGLPIVLPTGAAGDRSRGIDTADLNKDASLDFVVANRDQRGLRYLNNDTCTGPGNICNPFVNQGPNIRGQLADGIVPPDLAIDIDDHLQLLDVGDPDNVFPADFTAVVPAPFMGSQKYTCTSPAVGGNCPGGRITPQLGLTGPLENIVVRVHDGLNLSNSFDFANPLGGLGLRLTIGTGNAPTFVTTSPLPAATEDAAYSTTITGNDADGDNLLFDAPNPAKPLPAWLTLAPMGANAVTLSGTPLQAHVGNHTFTLRVRDRDVGGFSLSQDFTVTVTNVNGAPVVTTTTLPAGTQGVAYNTNLTASDEDSGQTLTFGATGLPPGLAVASAGGIGTISGTPTSAGNFPVTVTANDGVVNSAPVILQLNVAAPGNQNPTFTAPGPQTATVGTAFSLTVTGSDPDSDPLTFGATGLPPGLAMNAAGAISGTPTSNTGSPFTVAVTVNDGRGGTANGSFQLTVQVPVPGNGPPTITAPGAQTATVGQAFTLTVSATDPDGDPLTFSATGLPADLVISPAGAISGTPTTAAAAVTVTVTVNDGRGGTTNADFQLTVQGAANRNPTITAPGPQTATVGQTFNLNLASSATDPDGDSLTFSATGLPPGIAITAAGSVSGSATTATGSPFTVAITVNDGKGGTASATFQLTVTAAAVTPPPPSGGGGDGGGGSIGLVDLLGLLAMGALAGVRRRRPTATSAAR